MTFKFKSSNQNLTIYCFNNHGEFIKERTVLIEAGTGLPANSTNIKPETIQDKIAVFKNGIWEYFTDYRGKTIYHKVTKEEKQITELGEIETGFTLLKPSSDFDEWVTDESEVDKWVKDEKAESRFNFEKVDSIRESEYKEKTDPLLIEARIKRLQNKEAEAVEYEQRALQIRKQIQLANPYPQQKTGEK